MYGYSIRTVYDGPRSRFGEIMRRYVFVLLRWTSMGGFAAALGCSASTETAGSDPRLLDVRGTTLLFFAMASQPDAHMDALVEGTIAADNSGCLRLDTGDRHTVVWPHGFRLQADDDKTVVVSNTGAVVGQLGERFRLGGGEVTQLQVGLLSSADRVTALSRCPGRYWIVAG